MANKQALEDIDKLRLDLESRLYKTLMREVNEWQRETGLNIESIDVVINKLESIGRPKQSVIANVNVELDYKP